MPLKRAIGKGGALRNSHIAFVKAYSTHAALYVQKCEDGCAAARPASRAGLETGDLIVQAAGRAVSHTDDLFEALEAAGDGVIQLRILRGAEERTVEVQLGTAAGDASDVRQA